jgi:hypothetical protein
MQPAATVSIADAIEAELTSQIQTAVSDATKGAGKEERKNRLADVASRKGLD